MKIFMLATSASPDAIFRAGHAYDAPRRLALPLLKGGVPRQTVSGFVSTPGAELYDPAKHLSKGKPIPVEAVPARPDPGEPEDVEEFEEVEQVLGEDD